MAASRMWEFWANNIVIPAQQRQQGTFMSTDRNAIVICKYGEDTGTTYTIDGREVHPEEYAVVELPVGAIPGVDLFTQTYVVSWGYSELLDIGVNPTGVARNGYRIHDSGSGATRRGLWSEYDYVFPNRDAMLTAIDNGEIVPVYDSTFQFDIYINGSSEPSITTIPTYAMGSGLSTLLIESEQWSTVGVFDSSEGTWDDLVEDENERWVPAVSRPVCAAPVSIELLQNYNCQWLSEVDGLIGSWGKIARIAAFGIDGYPEYLNLLLRFTYDGVYGDLYRVRIPKTNITSASDILVNKMQNGDEGGEFNTNIVIHLGAPPDFVDPDSDSFPGGKDADGNDGGVYDPDKPPSPSDFASNEFTGFDGNAVLTKTYSVTAAVLQNIGSKLWSQSYFDVLKVQNNPIENIISVKAFPYATSGTAENIKVGDIDFGIQGDKIPSVQKFEIGSGVTYSGDYQNTPFAFLDFAPFTVIKLYLPFCGIVQLDASTIFKRKLRVFYVVDKISGQCMVKITADSIPFMNIKGDIGIDIPLTSSDRVQTELKVAGSALSTAAGVAGQLMSGDYAGAATRAVTGGLNLAGADYNSQRTAPPSPACSSYDNRTVFLLVEKPSKADIDSQGFKHLHGHPCHKFKYLKSFPAGSFVQMDKRTDINIAMTSEENRMLEELLTSGVYI